MAIIPSFCASACRRYAVRLTPLTEPEVSFDFYCITRSGRTPPAGLDALFRVFQHSSEASP